MISLTVTPDLERHAIEITIEADAPAAIVSLRRTDANGQNDVRLSGPLVPTDTYTTTDYEASLTGPLAYELVATVDSATETADATTTFGEVEPFTWIIHPAVFPEDAARVVFDDWRMSRSSRSAQHAVIGRPDPLINRDVFGLRTGTLDLFAPDYETVTAIETLAERGETVMIRQNDFPGLDGYFEIDTVAPSIRRETVRPGRVQWLVRLTLTEVLTPTGPLLAAGGWSYDDVLERFDSYRALADAYPSYRALLLDEAAS